MRKKLFRKSAVKTFWIVPITIFLLFPAIRSAKASLVLFLQPEGMSATFVIDNQSAGAVSDSGFTSDVADANSTEGVISFSGAIGSWGVNVTTGISDPVIGPNRLDLNSIHVTSGDSDPERLFLGLTDTDFTVPGDGLYRIQNSFGGTTDGEVFARGFIDAFNMEFPGGTTTGSTSLQHFVGADYPGGAFSGNVISEPFSLSAGSPFSITERLTISHSEAGQATSYNKETSVLPEPSALLLLGTGLLGVALIRKMKT